MKDAAIEASQVGPNDESAGGAQSEATSGPTSHSLPSPSASPTSSQTPPSAPAGVQLTSKLHERPAQVPETPVKDPLLGTMIDNRYLVQKRIARGGMATVYRAEDNRLDRPVALKIMHPHLAESADFVARFRREARAAARLTHPGVVAVYDQGVAGGSGYLVMELIEGPNLRSYLRRQGCFSLGEALEKTSQILAALAAAHRSGLVHRDVKPENVLLGPEGQCKVADFGLARAVSEVTAATTGSVLGTVAYLAPEVVTNGGADARVDVYAAGVMLYEMLSGKPPFLGESPIQVAYLHVHQGVPRIRESEEWVPPAVDDLIARLCARLAEERPLDASEALALLEEVRESLTEEELELRGTTPGQVEDEPAPDLQPSVEPDFTRTLTAVPMGTGDIARQKPAKKFKKRYIFVPLLLIASVAAAFGMYFLVGPGAYRSMLNVTGQSLAQAEAALKKAEIEFTKTEDFSDTVPAGAVISTSPKAGGQVYRFDKARLVISKGIKQLTMPDLSGKSAEEMTQILKDTGFSNISISAEYSDSVPQNQFIAYEPAAGQTVNHNIAVKIVLSQGPAPVTVPNLVENTREQAANILNQIGLKPAYVEVFSDTVETGKVISQSLAAGAQAHRGDGISVTISKGPELIEVPNVRGKSRAEAQSILRNAGFNVNVVVVYNIVDKVADQSPGGGEKLKAGSTVTIKMI